jgi:cell wall-associated NlpC family hydrolase
MLVAAAAIAVPVLPAVANPNDPPAVAAKQAEAARILAQVDQLDADLGRATEAYNGAQLRLARTTKALSDNTRLLAVARTNLSKSRTAVAERLVQLYTEGDGPDVVDIVLGASSLDEVITGLDAQSRIVSQDARIAHEVASFSDSVRARQQLLRTQQRTATRLAAETTRRRQLIEGRLQEREQLLSSIRDEVARMREAERVRQLELARQARARLVAQQAATAARSNPATGSALESQPPAPATTDATTSSPDQPASAASPPPGRYGGVVEIAMKYLGIPYRWGGSTPSGGFDCSGFTMYVYAQLGVSLPHYTGSQWAMGTAVPRDQLQPGDLVFFDGLGHEGIYIGGNQMIHAPHTGDVVKISPITGWYADTYMGARRL